MSECGGERTANIECLCGKGRVHARGVDLPGEAIELQAKGPGQGVSPFFAVS